MAAGKWKYHEALPVLVAIDSLIRLVPKELQWSCEFTDDTCKDVPALFNIYVHSESQRVDVRKLLKLKLPYEETDDTEYHLYTPELTVGLIES